MGLLLEAGTTSDRVEKKGVTSQKVEEEGAAGKRSETGTTGDEIGEGTTVETSEKGRHGRQ